MNMKIVTQLIVVLEILTSALRVVTRKSAGWPISSVTNAVQREISNALGTLNEAKLILAKGGRNVVNKFLRLLGA